MEIYNAGDIDVAVIGGGHGGCEAALAAARKGLNTVMFAINMDSIALMPCNPNIGGTSKGHLVREIDALGGEMGKNIDKTCLQLRMLNMGKGPAVYSLRVQADKFKYSAEMKNVLENTDNLRIKQAEITRIEVEAGEIKAVITKLGARYKVKAAVLCGGTYLKSRCLYGDTIIESGPGGLSYSTELSGSLMELGITLMRFKTGTPARIDKRSIDFSKMSEQPGDTKAYSFSFENVGKILREHQISCYLTYTNETTHKIIRDNLHRAPMYSGIIEGTGTRYCPSIEDKVVRFADKDRHQVFIEPEGEDTNEMYVQGVSTSLPEEVQIKMYRSIPGLENCEIIRPAYAIEYDCIDATQLDLSLMFKHIKGFFSAGQVNGSSGYEEAAAQGIMAGINAANHVLGREAVIISRSEGYIGVLIDDLVTKGTKEPYRMMTSRAEYRLLLRQDNADMRLTELGYNQGLITEERYKSFLNKKQKVSREIKRVKNTVIPPSLNVNDLLKKMNSVEIKTGAKLSELIKRPELSYEILSDIDTQRQNIGEEVAEQVNISIKYEGYIERQIKQVKQFEKMEQKKLPKNFNYNEIGGLRIEAKQKLTAMQPDNMGQAMRITGVSPADISVLMIYFLLGK